MSDLKDTVKILAIRKKTTVTHIAEKLGMTAPGLYQMIGGNPTLKNIQRIAGALEMKASELIALTE